MKKAYSGKRKSLFFLGLFAMCLFFFNISCGLDVLDAVLDDPFTTNESPSFVNEEEQPPENMYFRFSTSVLTNANDFAKGYIYYKIYNSAKTKDSEKSTIESVVSDSSRRHDSYTTLINNYSYQPLHYASSIDSPDSEFEFENDKVHEIRIRLTNYYEDSTDFSAGITVDNTNLGIPLRFNGKTFDFGRTGSKDEKPQKVLSSEESYSDVRKLEENPENDFFYVVLYGVFNMPTDTFEKTIYSPVHYLGEVKIDSDSENN
ncbi:MAG: hypothetical protein J5710_14415 [Treponema sp.]|nr:hypothetical protein [Treponema sp.]